MKRRLNKKPKVKSVDGQIGAQLQFKLQQALLFLQQGLLAQAQAICEEIIKVQSTHLDALHVLGVIAAQSKNLQMAVGLFDQTIAIEPNNATLYFNRALARQELKQLDAALADYDRAIALEPDYVDTHFNQGNVLAELKRFDAALASYDRAIALKPDYPEAHWHLGNLLYELKRFDGALASYEKAIAGRPDYAEAYNNRGITLQALNQFNAATSDFARAIALKPEYADAHYNRGNALHELKQFDAALTSYDRAIALRPDFVAAHHNRGNTLQELNQYQAALASYDTALAIRDDCRYLLGVRLHLQMRICDWRQAESQLAGIIQKINRNEKSSPPFEVLALSSSLPVQRKAAEIWVNDRSPKNLALGNVATYARHGRIRVGYFSMDFREHPLAFLTAELFESHDRNRFEIIAFSFGPNSQDAMRQRLEKAFEQFIEVGGKSDREIAELARTLEIDIAIDLAGFTAGSRTGIFAYRAAPVQVNFLGYPGTMGTDYLDYLLADRQVIPEEMKEQYSEKIVYLPCFQPNDRQRKIADKAFTREELGLPPAGFVFCCFNYSYKITPDTFAGWMRILQQVAGSVLWLQGGNPTAIANLRREAARWGVEAQRLVFAERLPAPEYLARFRCADLFLDTLPYNAGTTASDALWAGLPVLTCAGEAFASRMAAGLLTAIELPELITTTPAQYEALAVALATNPERLAAIRQKLAGNRLTTLLFDSKRFTRHLEAAYTQMYERCCAGLPPEHIDVEGTGSGQGLS